MSDTDVAQGQPSEEGLFREALDTPTLKDYENPQPLPPAPPAEKAQPRGEDGRFQKTEPPEPEEQAPAGQIPPGRLREESEARRRAEQQVLELQARVAAYEVNRSQQQQPVQKQPDIFEDPTAFVYQTMAPVLQQLQAENQLKLERQSTQYAQQMYGPEVVDQAYNAMAMSLRNGDATANAVLQNAKGSHDPYGTITRWYLERQTLNTIGGDLEKYRQGILENAMKDPNFQRQVVQAMRSQPSLPQVNRPVTMQQIAAAQQQPAPVFPPSVSEIGAIGGDELIQDASDNALFRAAVTAKRRPTR